MTPSQLVSKFKSAAKAGAAIGYTERRIHQWLVTGVIPYRTQLLIQSITGLKADKRK